MYFVYRQKFRVYIVYLRYTIHDTRRFRVTCIQLYSSISNQQIILVSKVVNSLQDVEILSILKFLIENHRSVN